MWGRGEFNCIYVHLGEVGGGRVGGGGGVGGGWGGGERVDGRGDWGVGEGGRGGGGVGVGSGGSEGRGVGRGGEHAMKTTASVKERKALEVTITLTATDLSELLVIHSGDLTDTAYDQIAGALLRLAEDSVYLPEESEQDVPF